ncbi:hypothetical protein C8J56DRAFT_944959 [Mycena floridula]|nr:hypothetical protein C8J56DRAFT_944883 [Mycena floridula]KAJ7586561.1 hypothetical protein C8J56DRAFT_944959 [Mycena floridula]
MMQDLGVLQTEVAGRRSTPLSIPELVNPSVENDMFSQPRDGGVTMTQDNPDHQSPHRKPSTHASHHLQYTAVPAASKPKMIEKIKTFLTSELDRHSVYLARTHNGRPKLPWVDFETKLKDEGLELINWPNGVPEPGKDERADPNKGIAGISVRDLTAIYRAIHSTTAPLELRRSSGPQAGTSSKRARDGEGNIQRPTKQMRLGNLLSFDRM